MRHLVLAAVLVVAARAGADQPGAKGKTDPELIQGTWSIVGLESGGKSEPEGNYRGNTLAFKEDKMILREGKLPSVEFTVALDPAKTPKAIDLTVKGNTLRGIYKLDGDDLTLCLSIGGPRPSEFATRPGGDTELFTLKRSFWERYSDKAFGFAVDLPVKPAEKSVEVETPSGTVAAATYSARSEMERVTYVVTVIPLPMRPDARGAEAALDAAQKAVLAEAETGGKAKVESEGKPKGPGASRELTIGVESPDGNDRGLVRARLFVAGDRVFVLLVTGPEDATKAAAVARFWNSFRAPADKKGKN